MFKKKGRPQSTAVVTSAPASPPTSSPPPAAPGAATTPASSSVAPSPLDVAKESFRELLRNPTGNYHFRQFLAKESSEENIDFWTMVEQFRARHKTDTKLASLICQDFIQEGAKKELNLDAVIRSAVLASQKKPNRRMFDIAQANIFELMFTDSYRRFMFL